MTTAAASSCPVPDGVAGGPLLPDGGTAPVFAAPWQAQAFALVLALHERGAFTWGEWAEALSAAIRRAQAAGDADRGDTYYAHWLDALETLLHARGLASDAQVHALEQAWAEAAERTPHGQPIELDAAVWTRVEAPPAAPSAPPSGRD